MRIPKTASAAALLASAALAAAMLTSAPAAQADATTSFEFAGRYTVPGGAEVSAIDGSRLYVLNGSGIDIVDITDPSAPTKLTTVDLSAYGAAATSVAAANGRVAVAIPNAIKTAPGKVAVLSSTGTVLAVAVVGSLPDMVTFDKKGKKILVANEGEPIAYVPQAAYGPEVDLDPEGTVSVIDVDKLVARKKNAVRSIGFTEFNTGGARAAELSADVRIFGPGASVAEDLEPEYITIADDSAFVTLQENNAIAEIDLETNRVVAIRPLALKDHSLEANKLDPSDREISSSQGAIRIGTWPVYGMPMPDGIASFEVETRSATGEEIETTYLVTANEGDARQDWPGYAEEARVKDAPYVLDPTIFPNATDLKRDPNIGRLTVTSATGRNGGDLDGDGDRDRIQAFGARSASIWTTDGALVWDSGDMFEQVIESQLPFLFNINNTPTGTFDTRSDNKGPEPEGVAIGQVGNRTLAFVVLERVGGFMVLDITNPAAPTFVQFVNGYDPAVAQPGDLGPEVVRFVPADQSPNGKPLVVVSNEVSGTVTLWSPASA